MTKKIIFVSVFVFYFLFLFFLNDLSLNDMSFVLNADMNTNVSIETHIKYAKLLILKKKMTEGPI
jgi:hypothetical protein